MKTLFKISVLAPAALLFFAAPALAAEAGFKAAAPAAGASNGGAVGEPLRIVAFLNPGSDDINAFEGEIYFPDELLDLKNVDDAGSGISLWLKKPALESRGRVAFSGITPGGFGGRESLLLNLTFTPKRAGGGEIAFASARALLNDGKGTAAGLTLSPYGFSVADRFAPSAVAPAADTEPPESFLPQIGASPDLAGGKWFVAFSTQDKNSGMDYYEIKEARPNLFGRLASWVRADSPYVLSDQTLKSAVAVKAVDKAGNARTQTIPPRQPLAWHEKDGALFALLAAIIAAALLIAKLLWRKPKPI